MIYYLFNDVTGLQRAQ